MVLIENVPNDKYINILPTQLYLIEQEASWSSPVSVLWFVFCFFEYTAKPIAITYMFFRIDCLSTALAMVLHLFLEIGIYCIHCINDVLL